MRNSQLLDNVSGNTFSWQRIDAVSDELLEIAIYIRFASTLQKRSYSELQSSSVQISAGDSNGKFGMEAELEDVTCDEKS
jgi:hypothetical protein